VGAPLNHQRAQCLIATAYVAANLPDAALRHAERCLALSAAAGAEQTPFDLATAFGCAARAYAIAGQAERASELFTKARSYAEQFDHPKDQALFEKLYPAP
jgi:hypothetical protein